MGIEETIASRRSLRRFAKGELPASLLRDLVALACAAPAPHGSRPWRFLRLDSPGARAALVEAMLEAWRADLERDGEKPRAIERRLARSRRQLTEAPSLLLACLALSAARPWPDRARRRAERDMFVQSLGAALQNLLLAAHARGLAAYLRGAPLFCQDAVRRALDLPADWEPAFLVLLGRPAEGARPPPHPGLSNDDVLHSR